MRISDWSSDVCSSDLVRLLPSRGEASNAIVIPDEALQTLEGRDVVLVRTKHGFRARNVTIGQRSAGRVEISSGLKPGDMIATKNAFLLKDDLGKGAGEVEYDVTASLFAFHLGDR